MKEFNWMTVAADSDRGLVRKENEDSYAVLPEDGCCIVSDGMGGGAAGEIASQIIVEYLSDAIAGTAPDSPGSRKYAIQQAIHGANRKIREYAKSHRYSQMGATLALILLDSWRPGHGLLCHIGDSRIYRFRQGELTLLTRDHTVGCELAASLNKAGKTAAAASLDDHTASPISHVLTRSIGIADYVLPEWEETELLPDDVIMVCSDGITTMLRDEEIQQVFRNTTTLDDKIAALTAEVRKAGAKDNYTVALCQIASELPEAETPSEEEIKENDYLLKISEERFDHAQ